MGGEGGEILLDGSIVADVGENGVEDGEFGAVGGDGKSGLGHEREQADGFEGDGFASSVGAGDDELAAGAFELDGDRDYGHAFGFQIPFEERVTGVVEKQFPFDSSLRSVAQGRLFTRASRVFGMTRGVEGSSVPIPAIRVA